MMMTSSFEAFCNRVTAVTTKKGTPYAKKNILYFLNKSAYIRELRKTGYNGYRP